MAYSGTVGAARVTKSLGQMVGLLLALYVFDRMISAIASVVFNSTYFDDATSLIQTLLPVIGILAAFEIVWKGLQSSGLV